MLYNRYVAKSLERQQVKQTRQFYHALAELNLELSKIHKSIERVIDKDRYKYATEYVDQFISYTTVWHLKFVYNLENPEVALLQIFHLNYIFTHEAPEQFSSERYLFGQCKETFNTINPYKLELVEDRYSKMLQYIDDNESPSHHDAH